jgi:hypothetical protein
MGENNSEIFQYGMKGLLSEPKVQKSNPKGNEGKPESTREVEGPKKARVREFYGETYVMCDDGIKGCAINRVRALPIPERKQPGFEFWKSLTKMVIRREFSHPITKPENTTFATYDGAPRRIVSQEELAQEAREKAIKPIEKRIKTKVKLI